MAHTFGDIKKFQYQAALKARLERALIRAYQAARGMAYQEQIMRFKDNMKVVEEIDDGRIPAGGLVHPIVQTKCKFEDKASCYLVEMRVAVKLWWEYQKGNVEDADIDVAIAHLEATIGAYTKLTVAGDVRNGYSLRK